MSAQAQVRATNLRASPTGTTFDVTMHGETWTDLFLQMPGAHNVQNALSAIAIGHELGLTETQVKKALRTFQGVKRRFTKTGEAGGVTVIDDYGHHPVEISAVLKAARQMVEGTSARIIAVAQPHRYSRLSDLMNEFATCFNEADTVFVADVYAAGESPIVGVSAESLVERLSESGHNDARYLKGGAESLPAEIAAMAQSGDFVICLGAGDITAWAAALPEALEKLNSKANRNAL
jgi:UDP-N-acetylmuramate--alanine ligase